MRLMDDGKESAPLVERGAEDAGLDAKCKNLTSPGVEESRKRRCKNRLD